MFKTQYQFSNADVDQIRHIIDDSGSWHSLDWRMQRVNEKLKLDRTIEQRGNTAQYVLTSIINHFKPT
jgi:hypothetical protein